MASPAEGGVEGVGMHFGEGIEDCGLLKEDIVREECIVAGYRMGVEGSPAAGEGDVGSTAVADLVEDSLAAVDKAVGQRMEKEPRAGDSLVGSAGMAVRVPGEHNNLAAGHRGVGHSCDFGSVDKTWYTDESSGLKLLQRRSGK